MMTTKTNDNSGGTGYCAGNDFTIKPLTTTVDIKLIRRLMATWHTNGLTDSNIRKILLLYFGEPAWMNLDKVYDRNMFGQIAKGMNFHSRHSFIEAILKSTGFGFIWKNKRCYHTEQNLMAFYSPIWHVAKENEVENEQISDENSNENMQNGVGYYNYNNIYIIKRIIAIMLAEAVLLKMEIRAINFRPNRRHASKPQPSRSSNTSLPIRMPTPTSWKASTKLR